MTSRKEEFRALMEEQLDALHRRIAELEALSPHGREHAISWDSVVGECRKRHEATMARLRELDAHGDETWHAVGAHIRDAVEALTKVVEQHDRRAE